MDIKQLDKLLSIKGGKLTLTQTTLPGDGLKDLLIEYNQATDVVIDGASKTVGTAEITIAGTSSFMNVAGLEVVAIFTLDTNGDPQACLTYGLIDKTIPANHWKFSTSFADLPEFEPGSGGVSYWDSLVLSEASYVLTTVQVTNPLSGNTLGPGLNFSSSLAPQGIAGLFDSALGGGPLILEGPISLPQAGNSYPQVPYQTFPWDLPGPTPGILLSADLGVSIPITASLSIKDTHLLMYTPAKQSWLDENTSYKPLLVIKGTLDVPKLGESVDLYVYVGASSNTATIFGLFHNVTFDAFSKLEDLVGGDQMLQSLPSDIQADVQAIAKKSMLQLDRFSLTLNSSFSGSGIEAATVTVGLPGLTWKPVSDFDLHGFSVQFIVLKPFVSGRVITAVLSAKVTIADADFDVQFQLPNFSVFAQLERGSSIQLTKLFADHLPSLPAPPALAINEMMLNAVPNSGEFDFFVGVAENPPWKLDVTPVPLTIYDVRAQLNKASSGTTGEFSGSMDIGKFVELSATYNMPGGFMVRSVFPKIDLNELISLVSNIDIVLPAGFDLSFDDTFILIEDQSGDWTFSIGTQVKNFGLLLLTAQDVGGKWNFGLGMEVDPTQLGNIPGLGVIGDFSNFVGLDEILLVVSAADVGTFNFPDTANFNSPTLGTKNIQLPQQAGSGLTRGINLYAKVNASKNKGFELFANYAGVKLDGSVGATLSISMPDPDTNSRFFLSIDFKINSNTSVIGEMGVLVEGPEVGVFLTGDLKTELQSRPVDFTLTGLAVEAGAFISGSVVGTLPPFHLTPNVSLQFSNLVVEIGIDDAGIPSFGLMGSVSTSSGFDSSIAIFFDSTDPAKSLLAGAVSDITLFDVIDVFTDDMASGLPTWLKDVLSSVGLKGLNAFSIDASLAKALDNLDLNSIATAFSAHGITVSTSLQNTILVVNEKGKIWSLTTLDKSQGITHYQLKLNGSAIDVELEAQLYLAPETTMLGNFSYLQGFKAIGIVDFLFLEVTSDTVILPSKGIMINESIKKISWDLGGITVFSITGSNGKGDAVLSLSTYDDPSQKDPQLQSKHFLVNGALTFLDFDSASAYVNIRAGGAQFEIKDTIAGVTLDLSGHFTKVTDIAMNGTAAFKVGTINLGAAGSIKVNTGVSATLSVAVSDPNHDPTLSATASLTVTILSHDFHIVNAQFSIDEKFFANLEKSLTHLIIEEILAVPGLWIKWVLDGAITIADSIAQILKDVFNITSWKDAAKLMWDAGVAFMTILEDIVTVFEAAFADVADFLESLVSECSIDTANALTFGVVETSLFDIAQPVLVEIEPHGDGNELLYLYYQNQSALEQSLRQHPEIWLDFVGGNDEFTEFSRAPVDRCIKGLTALSPRLPPANRQRVERAIAVLEPYRDQSWTEFRERVSLDGV